MKKRVLMAIVILGALLLAAGWLFGWFRGNRALAEVQQLQSKLADPNLSDDQRRALMQNMRTKMDALSPDARRVAFDDIRGAFEKRFEAHMNQILAMSQADRNKALDADIDRAEKQRAEMAARMAQGGAPGGRAENGRGANSGKGAQSRRGVNPSDDQRVSRLRNRLDRSSPEMRAKRNVYTQLINDRRKQRGLPPVTGRGGR